MAKVWEIDTMHCLEGNAPRNRQNHTVQHEQVICKICLSAVMK